MDENYNRSFGPAAAFGCGARHESDWMDDNLHSPQRRLIELRMEHADLDSMIDRLGLEVQSDDLMLRRLKKRRLSLRDQIARLAAELEPREPA